MESTDLTDLEFSHAQLHADISTGSINISGPIEFVSEYRDLFIDFISFLKDGYGSKSETMDVQKTHDSTMEESMSFPIAENSDEKKRETYIKAGIVHVDESGKISILKRSIPGSNNTNKTVNIALILAYFHNEHKVTNSEIIPICQKFSCYDSSNFAATFVKRSDLFIKNGAKKSKTWELTLTINGINDAENLLDSMRTQNGN